MERLTQTSDKGGVAFTFDLDVTCKPSEAQKIFKLADKLKHYEDLEEQGRLLELPCKVGDSVYEIIQDDIPTKEIYIGEYTVQDISAKRVMYCDDWVLLDGSMGELFFSKEAADQALAKMD